MSAFAPDHASAVVRASPNFGARRDGLVPDMVILHYTGMASGEAAEDWLASSQSEVSAHYLVHEDGRVVQMVREADRAWHAGVSSWRGETDINSRSIGIEIVNPGHQLGYRDFPEGQIAAVIALCRDIAVRHRVAPERFLAHSDVAPGRKADPGERFPWRALHGAGVGHLVSSAPVGGGRFMAEGENGQPVEALQAMLAMYGYGIEITGFFDSRTKAVVEAFQRHFRPELVDGIADRSTVETLHRLLGALHPAAA